MNVYESGQDYLERILMLSKKLDYVRSIDIANSMKITKQSVHRAIHNLKENGYIIIDNGHITLTSSGENIAKAMYERHTFLTNILIQLGVSEDIAINDACKIEHDLSEESFQAIKEAYNKR